MKSCDETLTWVGNNGLNPIPIRSGSKKTFLKGTKHQREKTLPVDHIKWFKANKNQIGVMCGMVSNNLCVFDVDNPDLAQKLKSVLPDTCIVETRNGLHFYFFLHESVKSNRIKLIDQDFGIDIQGEGRYVVCPPSIHPSGFKYRFLNDKSIVKVNYKEVYDIIIQTVEEVGYKIQSKKVKKVKKKITKNPRDDKETQELIDLLPSLEVMIGFEGRGEHPIHGSKSGENLKVDSQKNEWKCFRSGHVGGSKVQWYAVQEGIIECEESASMTTEQYRQVFDHIRERYGSPRLLPQDKKTIDKILKDPTLIDIFQAEFNKIGIVNEEKNRLILFYAFLGPKLLPVPVNIVFEGSSSGGKSWVTKASQIQMPPGIVTIWKEGKEGKKYPTEWYKKGFGIVLINEITSASLYRIGLVNPTFFEGKTLVMGELPQKPSDDQMRVQQIIRILLSEGEVNKILMIDGHPRRITLKGHPAFITNDATFEVENQLLNRTLLISPDESDTQTEGIVRKLGQLAKEPWLKSTIMKVSNVLSQIHLMLKPFEVLNLWGDEVSNVLLDLSKDIQLRRTASLVIRFIELRTLVFQHQRKLVSHKDYPDKIYLLSTREDNIETFKLLDETIKQTLTRIMQSSLLILDEIKNKDNEIGWKVGKDGKNNEIHILNEFTYNEVAQFKGWSRKGVYPHVKSLVDQGLLICNTETRPHKLKLNLKTKSSNDVFGSLTDILQGSFPEKPMPEGLDIKSLSSSEYGGVPPILTETERHVIEDQLDIVQDENTQQDVLET